jgi:hypothetical protein
MSAHSLGVQHLHLLPPDQYSVFFVISSKPPDQQTSKNTERRTFTLVTGKPDREKENVTCINFKIVKVVIVTMALLKIDFLILL